MEFFYGIPNLIPAINFLQSNRLDYLVLQIKHLGVPMMSGLMCELYLGALLT
jgi:hypothetical protein